MQTVLLIDANNLAHRNYHAHELSNSVGKQTGLTFGFMQSLLYAVAQTKPSLIVAVWDGAGSKDFRREVHSGYKAHRDTLEISSDFSEQVVTVKALLHALGVPNVALPGCEADDVIGKLTYKFRSTGCNVFISSNDGDLYQLIDEAGHVQVLHPKNGIMDWNSVIRDQKYGVRPDQIVDYKALAGDASDEYPGVRGVGPKTAQVLLALNRNLDGLFTTPVSLNLSCIQSRHAANILLSKADVKKFRFIAKLHPDRVPEVGLKTIQEKDMGHVVSVFTELEFNSMLDPRSGRMAEFEAIPVFHV